MKRKKIPAGIKRKILVEAGHRCAIPTCRSVVGIDIHHITPWHKCKEHRYPNLVALCPNCHRMAEKGDIDGAIRDYSEAIHLDLRHANAYKGRAIAYEKKGDVDAAVQDYGELIRHNPNDYSGYFLRGAKLIDKGDFRGAIGDFDQALQLKPKDYNVMALLYHYRAMAYAGRSDFSRAVEDLQNELGLIGDIITNREREKIRALIDKLRAKAKIGNGVA